MNLNKHNAIPIGVWQMAFHRVTQVSRFLASGGLPSSGALVSFVSVAAEKTQGFGFSFRITWFIESILNTQQVARKKNEAGN